MKLGKPFKTRNIQGVEIKYHKVELRKSNGFDGLFDPNTFKILVDSSLEGDELAQVILHEELEAVFYRNRGQQLEVSKDAKETMIDAFSAFVVEHYKITPRKKPIGI